MLFSSRNIVIGFSGWVTCESEKACLRWQIRSPVRYQQIKQIRSLGLTNARMKLDKCAVINQNGVAHNFFFWDLQSELIAGRAFWGDGSLFLKCIFEGMANSTC